MTWSPINPATLIQQSISAFQPGLFPELSVATRRTELLYTVPWHTCSPQLSVTKHQQRIYPPWTDTRRAQQHSSCQKAAQSIRISQQYNHTTAVKRRLKASELSQPAAQR
jgi:hypothetical protein